ncbi:hypothetical protein GH714_035143 [Hevea brasiliensis]|uniref:Uncharacterized protein n=1 Tax=Hevea brasiliensis TaxID=3981 RepID=A0A6A6MJP3_HEVBR|nr:hypothetical protein GH714_035143 [Hevea brasiliensis]
MQDVELQATGRINSSFLHVGYSFTIAIGSLEGIKQHIMPVSVLYFMRMKKENMDQEENPDHFCPEQLTAFSSCSMILLNKVVLSTYNFNPGISLMLYQFEMHKYCNADNSEGYDKYFDSNWGALYFPDTSESESVGCHVFDGIISAISGGIADLSFMQWFMHAYPAASGGQSKAINKKRIS